MAEETAGDRVPGKLLPPTSILAQTLDVLEDVETTVFRFQSPVASSLQPFQVRLEVELIGRKIVEPDWKPWAATA